MDFKPLLLFFLYQGYNSRTTVQGSFHIIIKIMFYFLLKCDAYFLWDFFIILILHFISFPYKFTFILIHYWLVALWLSKYSFLLVSYSSTFSILWCPSIQGTMYSYTISFVDLHTLHLSVCSRGRRGGGPASASCQGAWTLRES